MQDGERDMKGLSGELSWDFLEDVSPGKCEHTDWLDRIELLQRLECEAKREREAKPTVQWNTGPHGCLPRSGRVCRPYRTIRSAYPEVEAVGAQVHYHQHHVRPWPE